MVEHRFGDFEPHPKPLQTGRDTPAKIVELPRLGGLHLRLKPFLGAIIADTVTSGSEHEIIADDPRHGFDGAPCLPGQRHHMRSLVFRPARRQRPCTLGLVELRPAHPGDLAAPLASQQQDLEKRRQRLDVVSCVPVGCDFIIGKNAIALVLPCRRFDALAW